MTRSARITSFVLALLGLAALIWLVARRSPHESTLLHAPGSEVVAPGTSPQPTSNPESQNPLAVESPAAARTAVRRLFTLHAQDGTPIPDATISWTPVRSEWLARAVSESDRAWTEIDSGSTFATSDAKGAFELTFDGLQRAVVWITHPTHEAVCFQNVRGGSLTLPDSISMTRTEPTLGRVRHEDGSPAPGALVQQCASLWNVPLDDSLADPVARRLFQRQYRAEPDGRVVIHAWSGYQGLTASGDDLVSNLWTGLRPCAPELVLRPTFQASGTVPKHGNVDPPTAPDRVLVTTVIDTVGEEIGYLNVRADGTFGPTRLPCRPAREYSYALESDLWQPKIVRLPAPRPGDSVKVDFAGEFGIRIDVDTVSSAGTPIEGVRVGLGTECGDGMAMAQAFTNVEGRATFRNIRPGDVIVTTNKDGFTPTRSGRFTFFSDPGVPYRIELQPGGSLRGIVRLGGEPVRTFTVRLWNDEENYDDERHFQDRMDGSFEIGDVPAGSFAVVASALPGARGKETIVSILPGQNQSVELELEPEIVGTGFVLSAASGAPISGASIQPYLMVRGRSFGAFGPAHASGPDGAFRIAGFGTGVNMCVVRANGYAPATFQAASDEHDIVDFGWMSLQRAGRLDLALTADPEAPLEQYEVELRPGNSSSRTRLGPDGKASLVDLSPGRYEANVNLGRGRGVSTYVNIGSATPSRWEVRHSKVRELVALLRPSSHDETARYHCNATYTSSAGREEFYFAPFDQDLRCDLARIPADTMILDVVTQDMVTVATRWVTSSRSVPQIVEIELADAPLHVRFRTQSGAPVFPANVQFNQSREGLTWSTSLATDDQGELTLSSVPEGPFSLMVVSPQFRRWIPRVAVPTQTGQKLEITVSTEGSVELDVRDGTVPLAGLRLELQDPIGQQCVFDTRSTGPDGRVRFADLEPQEFDVSVNELGYWPTRARVSPTAEGAHQQVQVRRLGGVHIRATIVGTPLRRRELSLWSTEFNTGVETWVREGRVEASSSSLETDDDGRLFVDGLPNGRYRWATLASNGESFEGEFVVPPRAVADVTLAVP